MYKSNYYAFTPNVSPKHTVQKESTGEKMGLEGRFKQYYRKRVSERVDCSKLMVLDRRRPDNQKTLGEQSEEEGVKYEQTNGAGEREQTSG